MSSLILTHSIRFVFLVLFQVLILNNIQWSGYVNPFLYVLFILMLPLEMPRAAQLLLGFLIGLFIDLFTHTYGMHTIASTFMAYCRPYILKVIAPREDYEFGTQPIIRDMGVAWFLSYSGILILLHHMVLFFVEVMRLSDFFTTMGRVMASALFTLLLVTLSQFLIFRDKRKA